MKISSWLYLFPSSKLLEIFADQLGVLSLVIIVMYNWNRALSRCLLEIFADQLGALSLVINVTYNWYRAVFTLFALALRSQACLHQKATESRLEDHRPGIALKSTLHGAMCNVRKTSHSLLQISFNFGVLNSRTGRSETCFKMFNFSLSLNFKFSIF